MLLRSFVAFFVFCFSVVLAQQLPICADKCLETSLTSQSDCARTDNDCICTSEPLMGAIEGCVISSCTLIEALSAQNATKAMCGEPVRDITHVAPLVTGISGGLAIIAVIIRCSTSGALSIDNIFAVAAIISSLPMGILEFFMAKDGFGKDIWTIPPEKINRIIMFTWLTEVFYFLAIAFTKLSFLFFCLRIFPRKGFRKTIVGLMIFVVAYGIAFTLTCLFNCTPISYIWTNWDGEHTGTCINFHIFAWAHAGINIALDVVVLIVPIPELLALTLSRKKKLLIILMFSMGAFTTVVSIVRLQSLVQFSNSTNPTYDNVPTAYWSVLEAYVGIFCICMPAMRRFFSRLFPSCFASTNPESSKQQPYDTPDTPNKLSNGKRKFLGSSMGFTTSLRGTGITKTVDTVIQSSAQEDDEVHLVDVEMERMGGLKKAWGVEGEDKSGCCRADQGNAQSSQRSSLYKGNTGGT